MKKIYILSIIILFMSGACDEFLTESNPNNYSTGSVWKSEGDLRAALNAIYRLLPSPAPLGNPSDGELFYAIFSDDGWTRFPTNWGSDLNFHQSLNTLNIEYSRYDIIRTCNEFIQNAPDAEMDEVLKARFIAEARFLRAYYYARLNFLFGDVPLITEPQSPDFFPKRATQQKVFDFVLNELTEIANDLPESYSGNDVGRFTKGAALAIKAQHALNALWWHTDKAFLYKEAREACENIYNSGVYQLEPGIEGFNSLFTKETENGFSTETILISVFDSDFRTHQVNRNIAPKSSYSGTGRGHGHQMGSTNAMGEAFQMDNGLNIHNLESGYDPSNPYVNRDPRMDVTLVVPGEFLPTKGSNGVTPTYEYQPHPKINPKTDDITGAVHPTGYNFNKYVDFSAVGGTLCDIDFKLVRYAEVILMYAEAIIGEKGAGGIDQAIQLVDEVRTRVGMPDVATSYGTVTSPEQALDIVLHEKRVELAGEGPHRFFDIKRYQLEQEIFADANVYGIPLGENRVPDANVLPGDLDDSKKVVVGIRNLNVETYNKWPLPQTAIDNNPNLLEVPE